MDEVWAAGKSHLSCADTCVVRDARSGYRVEDRKMLVIRSIATKREKKKNSNRINTKEFIIPPKRVNSVAQ